MTTIHEPVMLKEVLDFLKPQPGQNFIDCTFGGGGHALAILDLVKPTGKVIGIDWDERAIKRVKNNDKNLILINDNYRNLKTIINKVFSQYNISQINGILFDLGLSSDQLAAENRGFGFTKGELDLRFSTSNNQLKAHQLLERLSEREIKEILIKYGEETLAGLISKKIVALRKRGKPIKTAEELAQLVSGIYKQKFTKFSKRHPATKVFQALRIAVNNEYDNLNFVLPQAINFLSPGGRLVVISFHSGEDRIVKNLFKKIALVENSQIKILTKKPVIPQRAEIMKNPRARSAKLRTIEKIKN